MSDNYPFSVRSWSDVFRTLRTRAEASRGTISLAPDGEGSSGQTWPRTTALDVLAICAAFDDAIHAHGSESLVQRWTAECDLVGGETADTLADTYIGNRSFWSTLASAVTELDRVHAALPGPEVWATAERELATARQPTPPRNASGGLIVTMFTERTWRAMAERQLMFFRLMRGECDGVDAGVPRVPETRNGDVLELARYWTDQLARIGQHPTDTFHRIVYSCWRDVLTQVAQSAKHAPAAQTYEHNPEFWSALILLTTQTDGCNERPSPWAFTIPGHYGAPRNAAPVDKGLTLEFPSAKTWDEAAQMQRDALVNLRGVDVVSGGLVARIPRTTVSDVRQLTAYWTIGLARVGEQNYADISHSHVLRRWRAAVEQVWALPGTTPPNSLYPHNQEFWTALMTIAIQVAVTSEAPTRFQLLKQAVEHSIQSLPGTLKHLPETLHTAVQEVVNKGGSWLSGILAKPLLYVGGGIVGLSALVYLLRRPPAKREEVRS